MKQLIIYAHPNPQSINSQLLEALKIHLKAKGDEIEIRDLNLLRFNPVLSLEDMRGQRQGEIAEDVEQEQQWIRWADRITIIHPIWWTGLPAILKGYIDRVFSYGFAYRYDQGIQKGLLKGKEVVIINTHGKSHTEYQASQMSQALSLTSDAGIYSYCGLEIKAHLFFDQADRANSETIEVWKQEVTSIF